MSDIGSLGSHLASVNNAAQARASVRPETPPPLTVQTAVAQTLNSPQAAVNQAPNAAHVVWQREADPDSKGQDTNAGEDLLTLEQVEAFLDRLNRCLCRHHTRLQFTAVGSHTDWQIRITDQDTGHLVRWISWPETRAFARALEELDNQSASGPSTRGGGLLRVTA